MGKNCKTASVLCSAAYTQAWPLFPGASILLPKWLFPNPVEVNRKVLYGATQEVGTRPRIAHPFHLFEEKRKTVIEYLQSRSHALGPMGLRLTPVTLYA